MKITISIAAYNEISAELEKHGIKADGTRELVLEKGTQLSCPVDFRLATIRRDVANVAAQVYKEGSNEETFVQFVSELYDFVINGKNDKIIIKEDYPNPATNKGWS